MRSAESDDINENISLSLGDLVCACKRKWNMNMHYIQISSMTT